VILAEGNTSASLVSGEFYVKASGFSMVDMDERGFVLIEPQRILQALDGPDLSDAETKDLLAAARVEGVDAPLPSTETFMHAHLLSLPEVRFVTHTHPTPLVSLLSLDIAKDIASRRIFPDEIVCCGPSTCFVPYTDPGLPLARAVRTAANGFIEREGLVPKTLWIGNHGLIALGSTYKQAWAATAMSVKAARIWLGALATGHEPCTLTRDQIDRIQARPDEHYRQRLLAGLAG
jgi:rhamnose utilization protein RhaD (predicted bifunctional aldolase and dehydrogenase)